MILKLVLLLQVLIFSYGALAATPQGNSNKSSTEALSSEITVTKKALYEDFDRFWSLNIDGAAIILKGFGLNLGWSVQKNARLSIYTTRRYPKHIIRVEQVDFGLENYGLRLDYYFSGDVRRSGFYSALTYDYGVAEAEIDPDPVFGFVPKFTERDYSSGPQAYLGYMFTGQHEKGSSQFTFNVALGYGKNGTVETNEALTKISWRDSFLFDLGLGFNF